MSSSLHKARSKLGSINRLLREGKLLAAVISLHEAINVYLSTQLLKHEKTDFQHKLEKAVFQLGSDAKFKQVYPLILEYQPNQEKTLNTQLREIIGELQEENLAEAKEVLAQLEQKKDTLLKKGQELLDKEKYDKAEKVFQELIRDFAEDSELKIDISEKYLEKNRLPDALRYLKMAHDDDPESVSIFNKLGIALRKAGKLELAEKAFKEAINRSQNDEFLYFNLGRVYLDWRKWEQAADSSQQAVNINENFTEAKKMLAFARAKAKC